MVQIHGATFSSFFPSGVHVKYIAVTTLWRIGYSCNHVYITQTLIHAENHRQFSVMRSKVSLSQWRAQLPLTSAIAYNYVSQLIKIHFKWKTNKEIHLNILSANCQPFCSDLHHVLKFGVNVVCQLLAICSGLPTCTEVWCKCSLIIVSHFVKAVMC